SERFAANTGWRLQDVATGTERLIVSVPEETIRVVLAPPAVAMVARGVGTGNPAPSRGTLLPNGHRAWGTYGGFRAAKGSAGLGQEWHHIVEQTPGNVTRFGGEAVHNTETVIALGKSLHTRISAFYSSIKPRITNSSKMTVREWLGTQSYEAQREFGLLAIKNIIGGIW
ncbi:MAG TPA: hypothetical protein VEU33_42900, partial [Archangium sp.]|nr:hypothetical protein [Archangium sp.]